MKWREVPGWEGRYRILYDEQTQPTIQIGRALAVDDSTGLVLRIFVSLTHQ
jgi:hypothetical protein